MNQTQANNFAALIGALEEQVHPDNFDMQNYVHGHGYPGADPKSPACGTACCAVGYAPLVLPKHFRWERDGGDVFRLRVMSCSDVCDECKLAFGITSAEYYRLFDQASAYNRDLKRQIAYMRKFLDKKGYKDTWN
jgi:hypothetical protein